MKRPSRLVRATLQAVSCLVLVGLGFLLAGVASLDDCVTSSKLRTELAALETALRDARAGTSTWPRELASLFESGSVPLDGWGHELGYQPPCGDATYAVVYSL